ncbi:tellurite resistance protein TerB [Modicisalibacter xianhensis]|uniref:Tellurite resistance protein TerB n=1 Tax=Modicisalibacter xianhensis TaxID=442341 RepID=A0A4R8FD18_9GAMM|nr:TerB N-terminal domain-containing protein [Halomonas xianhensis]TDX23694.1 tellurite resistance protein TerB [Halomonas xianhensis]
MWAIVAIGLIWLVAAKKRRDKHPQPPGARRETSTRKKNYTVINQGVTPIQKPSLQIEVRYSSHYEADPRPQASVTPAQCWVPAEQAVTVQGVTISAGRLFVGRGLPAGEECSVEPSLIDPDLAVNLQSPANHEHTMGYWPKYYRISPEARAGYLNFLATDRDDARAPMGFVFLYFYGLERRLLVDDPKGGVTPAEYEDLIGEIQRLLSVYRHSSSFKGYASRLLDYLASAKGPFNTPSTAPALHEGQNGLPGPLVVDLGIFSASNQPVPADWAYAWVAQDPQFRLRTAAERCPDEFRALFTLRYRERHGEGVVVKPNKTQVFLEYHPASPSIRDVRTPTQLPNITILKKPAQLLAELVDRTCDELDAYSRFIGKHPARRDSMEALALLPSSLANERKSEEVISLEARLKAQVQSQPFAQVSFTDLALGSSAKPTAKSMEALAGFLEQAGIGFEPDIRYTGIVLDSNTDCVIFEIQDTSQLPVSPAFAQAATVMRLAGFILYGQGDSLTERHHAILADYLGQAPLSELERQHLQAYFRWEIERKSTLAGMRQRVDAMGAEQRKQLEQLLVRLASADGVVDTDEIKKLRRTASLLGHDPEALYSHIHLAMAEPTVIRQASQEATGFAIPAPAPEATPATARAGRQPLDRDALRRKRAETQDVASELSRIFTPARDSLAPAQAKGVTPAQDNDSEMPRTGRPPLDPAVLQSKRAESAQVTGVLSDIFSAEEGPATGTPAPVLEDPRALSGTPDADHAGYVADVGLGGLDAAHMTLLKAVAAHAQGLPMGEAHSLASELRLLLAGAIDTINEAAFELTDAPVLEEDGGVLVADSEILEEMKG